MVIPSSTPPSWTQGLLAMMQLKELQSPSTTPSSTIALLTPDLNLDMPSEESHATNLDYVTRPEPHSNSNSRSQLNPSTPSSGAKQIFYGWKPWTLKPAFLATFAALTIGLIIALEVLITRTSKYGAITFIDFESTTNNYYLEFGALAVAVVYGLFWAGIDHDVKR